MGCGGSKATEAETPAKPEEPPAPEPEPEPLKKEEGPTEVEKEAARRAAEEATAAEEVARKAAEEAEAARRAAEEAAAAAAAQAEAEARAEQERLAALKALEPEQEPEPTDSSSVPGLGLSLAFLEQLASELGAAATTSDVLQQVVLPQTQATKGRFAQLHQDQVRHPTYFVKQQWRRGFAEMMALVKSHIHHMEPDIPIEQVGIWLDMLALNQHYTRQQQADLQCLQASLLGAKPTLVVMTPSLAGSTAPADSAPVMSDAMHDTSSVLVGPERDAREHAVPEQQVCLIMYRANEGLHGFHLFNTVHVKHL